MKHYSTSTQYYLTTVHKIKHNTILLHCSIKHYFTSLHATSVTEPLTALYIRNNHKNNYQNIANKIQNMKSINKCRHKVYDRTKTIISTHTHTPSIGKNYWNEKSKFLSWVNSRMTDSLTHSLAQWSTYWLVVWQTDSLTDWLWSTK